MHVLDLVGKKMVSRLRFFVFTLRTFNYFAVHTVCAILSKETFLTNSIRAAGL
jgi:hypothetical protein